MIELISFSAGALFLLLFLGFIGLRNLIHVCAPNQVLIFYGGRRRMGDRLLGYRYIKGGRGFQVPIIERVDRMDLTNMVIDISVHNAYSKGGIPLIVQGVANVKIAGHEPLLANAIERFLGTPRQQIVQIARATLEGSLRGILATMTPEQVNEDKLLFAERLVADVEQDMTNLGLIVDTMKIQNVQDDVKYLDSIGRQRNAQILSKARIAEAIARADARYRAAENLERESKAQIDAQTDIARADADMQLTEIRTRRAALVAEEQAQVAALVAQADADVRVQEARHEQVKRLLEADVVKPAEAEASAAEALAKAETVDIIEDARAKSDALLSLAETWREAGPSAREILLSQKLDKVIGAITEVIPETAVEKVTMIDVGPQSNWPARTLGTLEQIKQIFGIDVVQKLQQIGEPPAATPSRAPSIEPPEPPAPPSPPPPPQAPPKAR